MVVVEAVYSSSGRVNTSPRVTAGGEGGSESPAAEGTPGPPSHSERTLGLALDHVVGAAALVVRAELVTLTLPVGVEALSAAALARLCGERVSVGTARPRPPLPTLH